MAKCCGILAFILLTLFDDDDNNDDDEDDDDDDDDDEEKLLELLVSMLLFNFFVTRLLYALIRDNVQMVPNENDAILLMNRFSIFFFLKHKCFLMSIHFSVDNKCWHKGDSFTDPCRAPYRTDLRPRR